MGIRAKLSPFSKDTAKSSRPNPLQETHRRPIVMLADARDQVALAVPLRLLRLPRTAGPPRRP